MNPQEFDELLSKYADVIVHVGLNVQRSDPFNPWDFGGRAAHSQGQPVPTKLAQICGDACGMMNDWTFEHADRRASPISQIGSFSATRR